MKIKSLKKSPFTKLIFSLLLCLFTQNVAHAYSVSPLVLDIEVEKRELQTRDITLKNDSSYSRIYPTVNEVSLDEDGEIKAFEYARNDDRTDTVTSWLEISRGRINLEPNEVRTVPLTIRINPKAKPGLYHAFVGFPQASNKSEAQQRSMSGNAPGVIVRIAIDQERKEFLKLDGFTVERFVTKPEEDLVNYTIVNTGEAELRPEGEVIFYDTKGVEVASLPVNPEGVEVQPGETKSFASLVPEGLKAGKYKAYLSAEYGNELRASLTDTVFFYVMPLHTMLMIFGGVMLFAILLTLLIYRKTNQEQNFSDGIEDVAMYLRQGVSESQDHDIDLKNK